AHAWAGPCGPDLTVVEIFEELELLFPSTTIHSRRGQLLDVTLANIKSYIYPPSSRHPPLPLFPLPIRNHLTKVKKMLSLRAFARAAPRALPRLTPAVPRALPRASPVAARISAFSTARVLRAESGEVD